MRKPDLSPATCARAGSAGGWPPPCRGSPSASWAETVQQREEGGSEGRTWLPSSAGLSREKSHIVEPQLIGREAGLWFASICLGAGCHFRYRFSEEQSLANRLKRAQVQHSQGIETPRETQE